MLCGCVYELVCGRLCQWNYCSAVENVNRQTADGGCHIDFNTQLKHKTHTGSCTWWEKDAHAHTEKASRVVIDVDLSYLTLTALTLEKMKRKRRGGEKGENKSNKKHEEGRETIRGWKEKEEKREDKSMCVLYCCSIFLSIFLSSSFFSIFFTLWLCHSALLYLFLPLVFLSVRQTMTITKCDLTL